MAAFKQLIASVWFRRKPNISSESNVMLSLQLIRCALYHNLNQSVIKLSPMLVSMYNRFVFYWSQCYSSIIMIMYARSYYHKHTFYEHLFILLSVRIESFNPEMNQWTLIAPMRSRRSGVGVITYGNLVYAVSTSYFWINGYTIIHFFNLFSKIYIFSYFVSQTCWTVHFKLLELFLHWNRFGEM